MRLGERLIVELAIITVTRVFSLPKGVPQATLHPAWTSKLEIDQPATE